MQIFFDFFPIFLFLIAYFMFGMMAATAVAIGACIIQVSAFWWMHRRVETMQIMTLVIVLTLGGMTLWTKNALFFQWKPTIAYWAFGLVFLVTQIFGEKPMLQRMMDSKIDAPDFVWRRLNLSWILFFTTLGFVNLFVAYHYSESFWAMFKFFGAMGMMLVFAIGQSVYLSKYIKEDDIKEGKIKQDDKINTTSTT